MKKLFPLTALALALAAAQVCAQTTLPSATFTGPTGSQTIQGTTTTPTKGPQASAAPAMTMQANSYVVPNAASFIKRRNGATHALMRPVGDFANYNGTGTDFAPEDQNVGKGGSARITCKSVQMGFFDPIVYHNIPGISHGHNFFGNDYVTAFSDIRNLATSGAGGSCAGGNLNLTGYWTPIVTDMITGFAVVAELNEVYYKEAGAYGQTCGNGGTFCDLPPSRRAEVQVPPKGLTMIAGDPNNSTGSTSNNAALSALDAHYKFPQFICTLADGTQQANKTNFPGAECLNGATITIQIPFPECWDGVNLDSPDHRSHMAFSNDSVAHSDPTSGCPSAHPVPLPQVSFNLHYRVDAAHRPENWRLSSDNYPLNLPGGGSMHGDWDYGWRDDIIAMLVNNCDRRNVDCHANLMGNHATLSDDGMDGVGSVNPLWIQRTVARDGDTGVAAPTPANLRFGNPGKWVYKANYSFDTTFDCTVAFFGSDPDSGKSKICQSDDPLIMPNTVRVMMVGDSISLAVAPALKAAMTSAGKTQSELIGNAQVSARLLSDPLVNTSAFSTYHAQYVNTASGGTVSTWPGLHGDFTDIRAMMDGTYPDILILALGAYDVAAPNTTNELLAFTKIITQARVQNTGVRIFVSNLIPSTGAGQAAWESSLNGALAAWVTANTSLVSPITVVDQFTGFNSGTMLAGDGITPNSTGIAAMVTKYMTALSAYLH